MKNLKSKTDNKKIIANGIVTIFKEIKISILIGFVWFIGFSTYNKLFQYSLFDYSFGWAEAEEILGYKPSQYNFVFESNFKNTDSIEFDEAFLKKIDEEFEKQKSEKPNKKETTNTINYSSLVENNAFDKEIHTESIEISENGRLEVKKEIISKLFDDSIIFTLTMIGLTFLVLMLIHYITKAINWTNKNAD